MQNSVLTKKGVIWLVIGGIIVAAAAFLLLLRPFDISAPVAGGAAANAVIETTAGIAGDTVATVPASTAAAITSTAAPVTPTTTAASAASSQEEASVRCERVVYGKSGMGEDLVAYRIYCNEKAKKKVLLTFEMHAFEDISPKDGQALTDIGNKLVDYYKSTFNYKDVMVYFIPSVNPDGLKYGTTNNGKGRCQISKGIDINADFNFHFTVYTNDRRRTGSEPLSAPESLALAELVDDINPWSVIDFHGYINTLQGSRPIYDSFKKYFAFEKYETTVTPGYRGFFVGWAQNVVREAAIFEYDKKYISDTEAGAEKTRLGLDDYFAYLEGKKTDDVAVGTGATAASRATESSKVTAQAALKEEKLPIDGTKVSETCEQLIVVTTKNLTTYKATLSTYEKTNGKWHYVKKNLPAVVGKKGIMYNRVQNSLKSPVGVFTITQAFGLALDPGLKLPYRVIEDDDYWVTDSLAPEYYNLWVKGPSNGRWNTEEQEHLIDYYVYKYAAVIDFNTERTPNVGAAIFLHLTPKTGLGTQGCVGLWEKDLLAVLRWIDTSKKTRILICPEADISNF